jgi:PAS domain-containing protein
LAVFLLSRQGLGATLLRASLFLLASFVVYLCIDQPNRVESAERDDECSRRQEFLMQSEHNLRLVLDTIPALVWCAVPDGGPAYINKRMAEYIGIPVEEAQ